MVNYYESVAPGNTGKNETQIKRASCPVIGAGLTGTERYEMFVFLVYPERIKVK